MLYTGRTNILENLDQMMSESQKDDDEIVIDIGRILMELKKYWKFIIVMVLICGLIAMGISSFIMTEQYESKARIYLKPEITQGTDSLDYSSLSVNARMVNNYMEMIKGDTLMKVVSEKIGHGYSKSEIKNSLDISNTEDTEIIDVRALSTNPLMAQKIVNTTLTEFSKQMKKELNVKNILVIDEASLNKKAVSPNVLKNTIFGAMAGLIVALGLVAIKVITDKRLRNKEDAENYLGIPVLATIPYREIK